jgi:glycosyltransferase involved in cell wall biosynthesis
MTQAIPSVIESESARGAVLRGRDMICFGHDWGGDPLSKTHLMRLLARENRILWINSIGYRTPTASARDFRRVLAKLKAFTAPVKEVERNIFVFSPVAIPAYGLPGARAVNRWLLRRQILGAMRRLGFRAPIDWVFNPSGSVVAGSLGEDKVVYYCVDEFTSFSDAGTASMVQLERDLLARADLVIVSSAKLLRSKAPHNRETVLVRHGVDYDHFRKALDPETKVPTEIRDLPRPIIGYFGLMAEDWFDVGLVEAVARHFSGGSVVLLGKSTMDLSRLKALPNVHLTGRVPFSTLPGYCKGFDAAILPFPISEVTLNANPLKVREYLAAGLPVVSTRIPEVEVLGMARIADTPGEFVAELEAALEDPGPNLERSTSMQDEGWEGRLEQIRDHFVAQGGRDRPPSPARPRD